MLALDPAEAEEYSEEEDNNRLADADHHAEVIISGQVEKASLGRDSARSGST